MSNSNVRTSSAHSSASTLRPRTNRLISGLDEGEETPTVEGRLGYGSSSTRIASRAPSPYGSRPVSPIPPAHPQRAGVSHNNGYLSSSSSPGRPVAGSRQRKTGGGGGGADSPTSLAGLWGNSWTALQGIASDLLGSDLATADHKSRGARRSPSKLHSSRSASTGIPPSQWGPSAPNSPPRASGIGTGTREEQTAAFRAQKRKDMLTRQESSYADTLGKFKRRLSDDRNSVSAPPSGVEEGDRDALVYIHQVKKDDTLAGITIRYNISAAALRKANRMWPNDTVQARQTLVLPVDACGVKGKVASSEDTDNSESAALESMQAEEVPTPTAASMLPLNLPPPPTSSIKHGRTRTNSTSTLSRSSAAASSSADSEPAWQHDSWVILPGNTKPTQIARLPRRALGYFPPARRKSNNWSDLDSAPSSSLDLNRTSTNDSFLRQDPPQRPRHSRRTSNAATGYFPSYLTGPGGVGTMSRNVRCPGPAQDGLNKMFAKHLPDVAPPRNQNSLYQPEMPLYTDEATPIGSGNLTPAYPHSGGGSMGLENVGGAIESWVRRLATKTANNNDRHSAARASVGTPGRGAGGIGDLIEMTDEFEIGGDEEDELGRGRQGSVPDTSSGVGSSGTSYFDGAVRGRGKSSKAD